MITNSDCTIYNQLSDGMYKRTYIPACFWRNVKALETKKYGEELASTVAVLIFYDMLDNYVKPKNFIGDGFTVDAENNTYIVKGKCDFDVADGDISALISENQEAYRVISSTENLYGSTGLWHIKIEGV